MQPIATTLIKEVAKPAKDSKTEVIRSADFLSYTAEEALRFLGEGQLLVSDSFPGQDRNKLMLAQKVPLGVVVRTCCCCCCYPLLLTAALDFHVVCMQVYTTPQISADMSRSIIAF